MSVIGSARGLLREAVDRTTVRLGLGDSEERLAHDARSYWTEGSDLPTWRGNSHIRDAGIFNSVDWAAVGTEHWKLFARLANVAPSGSFDRVVEWGCGGGANAVAFAPHCREFVGVDVNATTLAECAREMAATGTPFTPVEADLTDPEAAVEQIGQADLFLCLYVLELVPSPDYGLRLMKIAADLLKPGALAFVQTKYQTTDRRTASRRHRYRESTAASMTAYPIDTFWTDMTRLGFTPESLYLVPQNNLDHRYAYYLLRKN
ncbi:class I SAM-dependent methyltransferase [Kribbella sandramycini]|uniref:2-polyprenyl-3-methyl-5-hydroxy-6-metoxy-1, 4-benzoquinol methylase n=1 Tax=Kribbella sandramycini TaxID=60450 RepID=A0A7Y4KUR7_9ACTN|nr:class I SAM-dependent methyltransferase [Kribbella sandramycini]MBB6568412.1 2-polyprenyl-3-methyl-5-hydroxy-6-metoxy-1,4-benzoquinol methylase [Kribbella sandramycini]NOL38998.1 class I SAM-dependent methyltransferase [Kribbella sandramycini]